MLPNAIRLQINDHTTHERGAIIEKITSRFNSKNYDIISVTEKQVKIEGVNLRYNFEIFEEVVFDVEDTDSGSLVKFNYIAVGAGEIIFVGFVTIFAMIIAASTGSLIPLLAPIAFWLQSIYKFHVKKLTAKNMMQKIVRE